MLSPASPLTLGLFQIQLQAQENACSGGSFPEAPFHPFLSKPGAQSNFNNTFDKFCYTTTETFYPASRAFLSGKSFDSMCEVVRVFSTQTDANTLVKRLARNKRSARGVETFRQFISPIHCFFFFFCFLCYFHGQTCYSEQFTRIRRRVLTRCLRKGLKSLKILHGCHD